MVKTIFCIDNSDFIMNQLERSLNWNYDKLKEVRKNWNTNLPLKEKKHFQYLKL